jgi:hypothetical protein
MGWDVMIACDKCGMTVPDPDGPKWDDCRRHWVNEILWYPVLLAGVPVAFFDSRGKAEAYRVLLCVDSYTVGPASSLKEDYISDSLRRMIDK